VAKINPFERRMERFLTEPVSVRNAASVIVTATAIVVGIGGVLMRVLDHREYPNIGRGLWWAIQTVTTVGYGDVTPKHPIGRIVGVAVMLEGIAFLTITTAVITSTFVARAQTERSDVEHAENVEVLKRLDALNERFDRLEARIGK
jgi:voltage-gated potassium channel Kch